jgi:hypothetical protein
MSANQSTWEAAAASAAAQVAAARAECDKKVADLKVGPLFLPLSTDMLPTRGSLQGVSALSTASSKLACRKDSPLLVFAGRTERCFGASRHTKSCRLC